MGLLFKEVESLPANLLDEASIWTESSSQCASCTDCMLGYHALQQKLEKAGTCPRAANKMLLEAVKRLEQLLSGVNKHTSTAQDSQQGSAAVLDQPQVVLGIAEVLKHDWMLRDAGEAGSSYISPARTNIYVFRWELSVLQTLHKKQWKMC